MKKIITICMMALVSCGPSIEEQAKIDAMRTADSIEAMQMINKELKELDAIVKQPAIQEPKLSKKAAKIKKKHPNWSDNDCELLSKRKIWIGMTLDMLKYMRGNPNRANPSNYGYGTQWQWCWDDYTPSCFYGEDDGIITSFN